MKISELITKLQEFLQTDGDLGVGVTDAETLYDYLEITHVKRVSAFNAEFETKDEYFIGICID